MNHHETLHAKSCDQMIIGRDHKRVFGIDTLYEPFGFARAPGRAGPSVRAASRPLARRTSATASRLPRAASARNRFSATYGISVTGIAGPGGGSEQKPVGLVYIGLAGPAAESCYVEKKVFSGGRDLVRAQAATRALDLLRRSLEGSPL